MSLTSEAKQEVERLLQAGQKIMAIKYLADTFGVSLPEAKLLVEAAEKEMYANDPMVEAGEEPDDELTDDLKTEVSILVLENKKIEAIKLVHSRMSVGLKRAKEIVDDIAGELSPGHGAAYNGRRSGASAFTIFSVIFALIGLILLGVSGLIFYFDAKVVAHGQQVTGTVVSLRPSGDGGTYAPDIEYTWNGRQHIYRSSTYTNPSAYEVDESVTLFVDPDDPKEIVIDSFSERWLAIVIVGGIGTLFTFFGLMFLFIRKKF